MKSIIEELAGEDVNLTVLVVEHRNKPYLLCLMDEDGQGMDAGEVNEVLNGLGEMTGEEKDLFFNTNGRVIEMSDDLDPAIVQARIRELLEEDIDEDEPEWPADEEMPAYLN